MDLGSYISSGFGIEEDLENLGNAINGSNNSSSSGTNFSPSNSDDALSQLYGLAKDNPEYMEAYLQLLAERENTANAQAWYERMSNTSFSRMMKDIQAAGYNPLLALSSLGGAGSGSVQAAGSWSTSPIANKYQKQRNDVDAGTSIAKTILGGLTSIAAIIAMMV